MPKPLPERIDASPEDIAKAMLSMPSDRKWKYIGGEEEQE